MITFETRQTTRAYPAWEYRNEMLGRVYCGDCARPDEMIPVEPETYFAGDQRCYNCWNLVADSTPIKITMTENYTLEHVTCKIF